MKILILLVAVLVSGCSTRQMVCAGTGTCFGDDRDLTATLPVGALPTPTAKNSQLLLPSGNYLVVRNAGTVTAIIQTSTTKK
jgi:hypothetical protein